MHGLSTSMLLGLLLLLHSAFMLSMVKMLLKEKVGGSALNSHRNYIADHVNISWKNGKLHGITALEINFLTSNQLLVNINQLFETLEKKK